MNHVRQESSVMMSDRQSAPPPDLRIVMTESLHPHEENDSQRSMPLMERLRSEPYMINPPIVAPMGALGASQYVILDGANRYHSFSHLKFPHILVQVAPYESGYVELSTWRHIVGKWSGQEFIRHLQTLPSVELVDGQETRAIAHILFRDGRLMAVCSPLQSAHERNAALCNMVHIYQRNATLNRTALAEPDDIWPLYPEAFALVMFPHYEPADIIAAARYRAFLPPGISRHIVHGRAVRVNYPMDALRDESIRIAEKNEALQKWVQQKLANRQVRYYAEATYQFDE
jgi:L-serine kinase (ATP) / ParB family transcriptional regulator, heme-responsive regulator